MFWDDWQAIWNGEFDRASAAISPELVVHASMMDGSDSAAIRGPEGLVAWIARSRMAFGDLEFETLVGPIVDGDLIAGHWRTTGVYRGGMPGATAAPGTGIAFSGTDVLRLVDGRAVEYWLVSDVVSLLTQLGVSGGA